MGYWTQREKEREKERKDAPPVELCENSHRADVVIRV